MSIVNENLIHQAFLQQDLGSLATQIARRDRLNNDFVMSEPYFVSGTCASSINTGDCVFLSGTGPAFSLCDPADSAKMPAYGIVESKPSSTSCTVRPFGMIGEFVTTGLTALSVYYVGSAGRLVRSADANFPLANSIRQPVGIALTTTLLFINPGIKGADQALLSVSKLFRFNAPAAKGTNNVHAAVASNAANAFPGPITSPAVPRNLRVVFAAAWDGGDVVATGTDQFDKALTETFLSNPGNTVVGVKVFKTVTSISKTQVGATANTATVGTGDKLGIAGKVADAFGLCQLDANPPTNDQVTVDATNSGFTPATVPNGAIDYRLIVNILQN